MFLFLQHCIDKVSVPETEMVHAHVIKTGTHEEFFVMSFLVNVYAKCGVMVNARKVFDNLPRRNVVVWTTLMTGYVQNSQPEVAVEVFGDMLESGSFPSNFTLSIALNACSSLESITLGKQFHAFIIKYRISHDSSIGNALCHAQAMDLAKDNFSAQQTGTEALGMYLKLNRSGRKPDLFTLSNVVVVGTALVDMYDKCGSIERARKAFFGYVYKNIDILDQHDYKFCTAWPVSACTAAF
ncbi:hypothetical protein D5086_010878 [Populus alba]|uniref:Uncharacterized protein n=1 Tax=Populus alba TaxID=43335 RepID=A0ACC4CAK9_POPAL